MKDLKQILPKLSDERLEELEFIRKAIIDTNRVDIIVLFGSFARGDFKDGIVKGGGKKSDFDVLVITEDTPRKKQVVGLIRNAFVDLETTVQPLVANIKTVNQALEEGQYFYSDIKKEGIELYNSGRYDFASFKGLTPTRRREIAEYDFNDWYSQAKTNFRFANIAIEDGYNLKASFELQQTVEMCFLTIEMVFSHYNPHQHNLFALRDRNVKHHFKLKGIFQYESDEERKLFEQLNFAYIGGRYRNKDGFPVDDKKIEFWLKEVKSFLELTEDICLEKIEGLKSLEANSLNQ